MPAYTYRATGTIASNSNSAALVPGAPAGKAVGDLLALYAFNRVPSVTIPTPTGWKLAAFWNTAEASIALFLRIADGTATDTPSPDWSGTDDSAAWIEAYHGDVYTDLNTIVVAGAATDNTGGSVDLILPALPITKADTLVLAAAMKRKTATSNDATTVTAPSPFTKRTELIMAGTALAAVSGSNQQTTATSYAGANYTINGTGESLQSVGFVISLRTTGTVSTIAIDAETENVRTLTTTPQTFSHVGAAAGVKGVVLALVHGTSSTDHVSAASYGGTAMARVQRNVDTVTEAGAAEWWFLGASVPQGTQTVSYTPGATTDDIHSVCITLLALGDLEVIDNDGVSENAANPSVTLSAAGREIMCFGAHYGGDASPTAFVPNDNCITVHDHDLGAFYSEVIRQNYSAAADFAIGGTAATEDVAFAAIAVAQVIVADDPAKARRLPLVGVA